MVNRILEFSPSQEEAVVSRILVLVHQAVDVHFPTAHTNRQFTKTVFSDDPNERTAALRPDAVSGGEVRGFGSNEITSPDGRPAEAEGAAAGATPVVPPPPGPRPGTPTGAAAAQKFTPDPVRPPPPPRPTGPGPAEAKAQAQLLAAAVAGGPAGSKPTHLDTSMTGIGPADGPDWITRVTLALLIAGLVLLAYVLFS